MSIGAGETLHDVAIKSLGSIPGNEAEKFLDLANLIKSGRSRTASISVLQTLPEEAWSQKEIGPLVDNLIGYLSTIPAQFRTSGAAESAIALTRSLSKKLPAEAAKSVENRLQNLDVRIIAIGTVPAPAWVPVLAAIRFPD